MAAVPGIGGPTKGEAALGIIPASAAGRMAAFSVDVSGRSGPGPRANLH